MWWTSWVLKKRHTEGNSGENSYIKEEDTKEEEDMIRKEIAIL